MAREKLSAVLCLQDREYYGSEGGEPTHYCPGCKALHTFNVNQPRGNGARWTWDGNVVTPTFSPSMNIRIGPWPTDPGEPPSGIEVCHYFLRAGRIEFLGDCTHALAGQTVDLPELP